MTPIEHLEPNHLTHLYSKAVEKREKALGHFLTVSEAVVSALALWLEQSSGLSFNHQQNYQSYPCVQIL